MTDNATPPPRDVNDVDLRKLKPNQIFAVQVLQGITTIVMDVRKTLDLEGLMMVASSFYGTIVAHVAEHIPPAEVKDIIDKDCKRFKECIDMSLSKQPTKSSEIN